MQCRKDTCTNRISAWGRMEAVGKHKSFELNLIELVKFLGRAENFDGIDFPLLMQILAKSYITENLMSVSNIGPFFSPL